MSIVGSALRFYQSQFQSNPYVALAVTNGILNATGDVAAQTLDRSVSPLPPPNQIDRQSRKDTNEMTRIDWGRVARFTVFGFGIGPCLGSWMFLLNRALPISSTSRTLNNTVLKRVVADQTIMAPLILTSFFGSMGLMEGLSSAEIQEKHQKLFLPLLANWSVWPIIQLANFSLVPLPLRVPFQSFCGVGWTVYISILNSTKPQTLDSSVGMA